jgi:hypothetical protein
LSAGWLPGVAADLADLGRLRHRLCPLSRSSAQVAVRCHGLLPGGAADASGKIDRASAQASSTATADQPSRITKPAPILVLITAAVSTRQLAPAMNPAASSGTVTGLMAQPWADSAGRS